MQEKIDSKEPTFSSVLKLYQGELEKIVPDLKKSVIDSNTSNLQRNYVDEAILPSSIKKDTIKNYASAQESKDYEQGVASIAYHVASTIILAHQNYQSIFTSYRVSAQKAEIGKLLTLIDSTHFIPKVFNKKTQEIAISTLKVLNALLSNKELLAEVQFLAEPGFEKKLRKATTLLSQRVRMYDAHSPETINKIKDMLEKRDEHIASLKKMMERSYLKHKVLEEQCTKLTNSFGNELSSINEFVEVHEPELISIESQFQKLKTKCIEAYEKWHIDTLTMSFKQTVPTSAYVKALVSKNEESIKKEWVNLYNQSKMSLSNEPLLDLLLETGAAEKQKIEKLEKLSETIENLRVLLSKRKHDEAEYLKFQKSIQDTLSSCIEETIPENLAPVLDDNALLLSKDLKQLRQSIGEINSYKRDLIEGVSLINTKIQELNNLSFEKQIQDGRHISQFRNELNQAIKQLDAKLLAKNNQLAKINTLYTLCAEQIVTKEFEIAVKDEEQTKELQNNQKAIDDLKVVINEMSTNLSNESKTLSEHILTKQNIHSATPPVIERNDNDSVVSLMQKTQADLYQMMTYASTRQQFLQKAKDNLDEYKQIINDHQGIYIPKSQIPKDDLKRYLEITNDCYDREIEQVYQNEEDASDFLGFNMTTLWDYVDHFVYPNRDLDTILDIISDKLDLITEELELHDTLNASIDKQKIKLPLLQLEVFKQLNNYRDSFLVRLEQYKNQLDTIIDQTEHYDNQNDALDYALSQRKFMTSTSVATLMKDQSSYNQMTWKELFDKSDEVFNQLNTSEKSSDFSTYSASYKKTSENYHNLLAECLNKATKIKTQRELLQANKSLSQTLLAVPSKYDDIQNLKNTINFLEKYNVPIIPQVDGTMVKQYNEVIEKKEQLERIKYDLNKRYLTQKHDYLLKLYEDTSTLNDGKSKQILLQEINEFKRQGTPFIEKHFVSGYLERLGIFENRLQTDLQHKVEWRQKLQGVYKEYFGDVDGISGQFGQYLKERQNTFWIKDFFRDLAALLLGVFSYKSDKVVREEYLNKLQSTFKSCIDSEEIKPNLETLNDLIDLGKVSYKPRNQEEEVGGTYNRSLQKHLIGFKKDLTQCLEEPVVGVTLKS